MFKTNIFSEQNFVLAVYAFCHPSSMTDGSWWAEMLIGNVFTRSNNTRPLSYLSLQFMRKQRQNGIDKLNLRDIGRYFSITLLSFKKFQHVQKTQVLEKRVNILPNSSQKWSNLLCCWMYPSLSYFSQRLLLRQKILESIHYDKTISRNSW